ncbi:hypothetical protein GCK72_017163 [Caenorhabditis remanei]|nr:hypothetical protein GCK72_017160 [Caenorhabditis remanei]XP_053580840.1 hypothetical protein GCK72_017163 [Caenorhabditis remanei]KAF1750609.1 hypothetical protein GCK72_017160 [Caenorhabditis remanei]KAF1750612.1 hypothetical protein GCK72_017163 [Caenorhabditis remanei]
MLKVTLLVVCFVGAQCSWFDFPECEKCPAALADAGSDMRLAWETAERFFNHICAQNSKTEINCLKLFLSAKDIAYSVNDMIFPRKTEDVNRSLSCAHVLRMCEDRDADGHELPRNVFSCQSCETLFNVTITLLKNPIDKLNKAAADILCVGAPESCRSEFLDIVEIVGAVGKMFRGKLEIKKVCEDVMSCK